MKQIRFAIGYIHGYVVDVFKGFVEGFKIGYRQK